MNFSGQCDSFRCRNQMQMTQRDTICVGRSRFSNWTEFLIRHNAADDSRRYFVRSNEILPLRIRVSFFHPLVFTQTQSLALITVARHEPTGDGLQFFNFKLPSVLRAAAARVNLSEPLQGDELPLSRLVLRAIATNSSELIDNNHGCMITSSDHSPL